METLEAVSTVLGLWPKCFQPTDKWRQQLVDEFDEWHGDDRRAAIERVKATHNGRRVNIETFRQAKPRTNVVRLATSLPAAPNGMHKERGSPCDTVRAFRFRESRLRTNDSWARFLDSIHPTAEHMFFADLDFGEFAHAVRGGTAFGASYIRENWHQALETAFGRPVTISPDGCHLPKN